MFKETINEINKIDNLVDCCKTALDSDASTPNSLNTQSSTSNTVTIMNITNYMVVDDGLLNGSDLWCYSFYLLENVVRREMSLNMEDDACRMAWFKYMHGMKEK